MRADWVYVIPHKIDGFPTRSFSRGRVLGFVGARMDFGGISILCRC